MPDAKCKVIIHVAAVEVPERRTGQVGLQLTKRTVIVNHGLLAGHSFGEASALIVDNAARCAFAEFGKWCIEPLLTQHCQTGDLGRHDRVDLQGIRLFLACLFHYDLAAAPEQVSYKVIVHHVLMGAEATEAICGPIRSPSRAGQRSRSVHCSLRS